MNILAEELENAVKTARDLPDYYKLPLLTVADKLRTQQTEIERLRALVEKAAAREYNPFEPDNQSKFYDELRAELNTRYPLNVKIAFLLKPG